MFVWGFCVLLIFERFKECLLGCLFVNDVFLVFCWGFLILFLVLSDDLLFCLGCFFCVGLLILENDIWWFFEEDLLVGLECLFCVSLLIMDDVFVFFFKRFDGDFCVGVEVVFVDVGFWGSLEFDEGFFLICLDEFFWEGLFWILELKIIF